MTKPISLFPGITLRCFPDHRFKHGCLSVQMIRPMCREEAALNALLPAVLLRGSRQHPDLRSVTLRLDDLYGASVGTLVRRVGDWQATGLYCSFIDDRFAMAGDSIFSPMVAFAEELLLQPILEKGAFRKDFVESEKKNLISTIESQLNDKRAYAMEQMLRRMCSGDSFGLPRLGEVDQVKAITAEALYNHYRKILRESAIELCYVGTADESTVAALLKPVFEDLHRSYVSLPPQTAFSGGEPGDYVQTMDISQGKLCMGFCAPVTTRDRDFVAMQVFNMIFGGGMTSKLFANVRERMSLCYAIGSGFHGSKGILTVSAGIDSNMLETVRAEVLNQLDACRNENITGDELTAAKQALRSSLLSVKDSPGAIENFYATAALSGLTLTPEEYIRAVEETTIQQVAHAARQLQLHTVYFLKGVSA